MFKYLSRCSLFAAFFVMALSLGCAKKTEDPHAGHDHGGAPCGSEDADHAEDAVVITDSDAKESGVTLATLTGGTLVETRILPGEILINEDRMNVVTPKAGGIVRSVQKSVGDIVTRGETLAVLESTERAEAVAEFLGAHEALALAREVFEREKKLHTRKVTSEQELLEARMAYREAELLERVSKRKLSILGISAKEAIRLSMREGYNFTRLELKAPLAGVVTSRDITLGTAMEVGDAPFVVADLSSVWVDLAASVQDATLIAPGMEVVVEGIKGVVEFVSPTIDHETRKRTVRVVLNNIGGRLVPGGYTKGRVVIAKNNVAMLVPKTAIHYMGLEAVVFVKDADGFEQRVVELGRSSDRMSQILSGLKLGDTYVAKGGFAIKAKILTSDMDPHAGHGH